MISVLVVGGEGADLEKLEGQDPSVEVLLARGLEDALEKLGRNRRIDAVLLVAGIETRGIAEAIREESPAHPPLFVAEEPTSPPPQTTSLPAREPAELLNLLKTKLEA